MSNETPPLLRPIPRRPFDVNFISATPPSDTSGSPSPILDVPTTRLLSPKPKPGLSSSTSATSGSRRADSEPISRSQSMMNLTSPTLLGIYSSTSTIGFSRRNAELYEGACDREELDTPWGTGAQTPLKRQSDIDEPVFQVMKVRSSLLGRRRSSGCMPTPPSYARNTCFLLSRVILLFFLGMGYGALLGKIHRSENLPNYPSQGVVTGAGYEWPGRVLWGVLGVALGAALPWFDKLWADAFAGEENTGDNGDVSDEEPRTCTDWAMAVRSIGAFVGIVFAIRRLPWASTLQVSLTLALVNPFLWYLIDRSKPGFLLSAAVGLGGSAVLLGVDPDIMPTPSILLTHGGQGSSPTHVDLAVDAGRLRGVPSQRTLEAGIWMLSVLFCTCVCFGNIGRRLALRSPSVDSGRWVRVK